MDFRSLLACAPAVCWWHTRFMTIIVQLMRWLQLGCWCDLPLMSFLDGWSQIVFFWTHPQLCLFDLMAVDNWLHGVDHGFPSYCFRDLGVTLDQKLSSSQLVNLVARSYYYNYQRRQWLVVTRSFSLAAALVRVQAFVPRKIDRYCSVLVGLPFGVIGPLDRVLEFRARLAGHIPK